MRAPPGRPAGTTSAGASACSVGSGEHDGYTYLLSLQVSDTTCPTGLKLVRAKGKLHGWKCSSKTLASDSVQYDAEETCTSGRAGFTYKYTQNR